MLKIIKTRLEGAKGIWLNELPSVLWAYRTRVRTPTRETPFKLAYVSDMVIPAEVGLTSYRVAHYKDEENEPDELANVLWAYRMIVRTLIGETPFKLAYVSDVVIPMEVGLTSYRVAHYKDKENEKQLHLNLDLIDKVRIDAK